MIEKPYGSYKNILASGITVMEVARVDASLATSLISHWGLAGYTIQSFGSEEQKKKWIPKLRSMEAIAGWALTEDKIGSDASNLNTSVKKVEKGYILNGVKRWIGNANRDIVVVWARNEENKKVEGFIVQVNSPGLKTEKIQNKLALRIVENIHLTFNDVFIPEENKLPGATDFSSVAKVLAHSRIIVAWAIAGLAVGVYDNVIKYVDERKQFGVKITSFQLIQDKLVRMMASIQGILGMLFRISELYDQGKATIGMIAMTKAWASKEAREITRLRREAMGGNGIIMDNYAMKALVDLEGMYTYEGTYDINNLVCGRELTGVAAFKAGK